MIQNGKNGKNQRNKRINERKIITCIYILQIAQHKNNNWMEIKINGAFDINCTVEHTHTMWNWIGVIAINANELKMKIILSRKNYLWNKSWIKAHDQKKKNMWIGDTHKKNNK